MNFQKVVKLFDELKGLIVMVNKFSWFEKTMYNSQGDNCISLNIFLTKVNFINISGYSSSFFEP